VSALTLLAWAACSSDNDATTATVPPTSSSTTVATSDTTTTVAPTTSVAPPAATTAAPVTTTVNPGPVTTANPSQNFDFQAPPTEQKDVAILDVYRNFMAVQEQVGLNLSDPALRAQLAAITTSSENAALQKAFDDLVAQGATYKIVQPTTYHPFVLYGDGYRDGLRTVGDCFVEAAAYVDPAGNPLKGETLDRASKGFVAQFELHDGKWLASTSRYDSANCLVRP
jgi:hypothetical protein